MSKYTYQSITAPVTIFFQLCDMSKAVIAAAKRRVLMGEWIIIHMVHLKHVMWSK